MADGASARGGLLVAGATSDAGKSVLTPGICRRPARQGVSVAPLKARNMSNNSAVLSGRPTAARPGRCRARSGVAFAAAREARFDRLADAVDAYVDTAALPRLIESGPTPGLPVLPPGRDRWASGRFPLEHAHRTAADAGEQVDVEQMEDSEHE